jgi:integrase
MAVLEVINQRKMFLNENNEWDELVGSKPIDLPQIFFDNGEPWLAVNKYASNLLNAISGNNPKTITSKMNHLKAYASWLEQNQIDWRHFPKKQKDRCLFKYRGDLIDARDTGELAPSTVTTRMGAVIQFYRYAQAENLLGETSPLWKDNIKTLHFYTTVGFSRTMSVLSSELSIPNRKTRRTNLEDGLLPITESNRDLLLKFLFENSHFELFLMCLTGFYTGARSETIRTLKISTLEKALNDPISGRMKKIAVGPGTGVKTKNNVSGQITAPDFLVSLLLKYAYSAKRLARQAKADKKQKDVLFLSVRGNPYSENTFTKLFSDLRKKLMAHGYTQFTLFKFHQSRATYGTNLMRVALENLSSQSKAIKFVKDHMLHKHDSTTWKYITFLEESEVEEVFSEEFFGLFTGKLIGSEMENLIDRVTFQ